MSWIDKWAPDWWQYVEQRQRDLPAGLNAHLLIDSSFAPRWFAQLPLEDQAGMVPLFRDLPGDAEALLEVSPMLLQIGPGGGRLGSVLNACSGAPMLSLIETPESLATLAGRLAPWCIVRMDTQYLNLRFPDTRRLPGVWAALAEQHRAEMAGPAVNWHFLNRQGGWTCMPLSPADCAPASEVILEQEEFDAMMDDAQADELLSVFVHQGAFIHQPHSWRHAAVLEAIAVAGPHWQGLSALDRQDWCQAWCSHREQGAPPRSAEVGATSTHSVWQAWAQDRQHINEGAYE